MSEEIRKICKDFNSIHNMGIKVLERGGRKLSMDVKSNPLGDKNCRRPKCEICKGEKPGMCDIPSCGYRQTCSECKESGIRAEYEGESAKTCYERSLDHVEDMRKEDLQSPLWKHCTIVHQSRHVKFEVEVTGTHKTVLERLTDELVRIKVSESDTILNSKNDWTQPPLIRVVPVTGNRLETQIGDDQPGRAERLQRQRQSQTLYPANPGRVTTGQNSRERRQSRAEPEMTAQVTHQTSQRTRRTRRTAEQDVTAEPSQPPPRAQRMRRAERIIEEEEEEVTAPRVGDRGERRRRREEMAMINV
jgi:hypothetical protein